MSTYALQIRNGSKEDEFLKISTFVFVANFPNSFGANDLWNTCKQYGQVVDAYIPYRRSKVVWVGRHKLKANISRFQREPLKRHNSLHNIDRVKKGNLRDTYNSNGVKDFVEDNDEEEDSKVGSYEEVPNGNDVKNVEDLEGHFKKSDVPKSGGSILQLIDDLVKVGETISASVGNSGGILCVEDRNMFKKMNSTILDYFVMVRGDWMPNGKQLLIISVYAPQALDENKLLWDYLSLVMSKWEGEVDGYDKFIEDSWKDAPIKESNALVRMMKKLKYLKEKSNSLEAAQKAKIKWAIKGDENSKYYHGVINKKGNHLSIRGILVEVTKEEIKKEVWDCAIDKSFGSDGFTFGFYRRYWKVIQNDVVDAMTCFFHQASFPKDGGLVNEIQSAFVVEKQILDVDVGLFKGIELAYSLNLSRMFYADDAIFNGQWSESNIDTIVKVLDCFNRASVHRINMTKSKLLGIYVEDDKVWHFITQGSSLWARVIKVLHDYDGEIGQKVKSCYPSLWLDIIDEVEMFKSRGIDLVSLINSKLSNGANTSFWVVAWREGSPFKSLFPRLYALETKKINVA
nr:RNA-directed DNA polymerase, eukaryota, reverse transcriptase zinc-binding domain protein [Tanacetum cinerariifolium]